MQKPRLLLTLHSAALLASLALVTSSASGQNSTNQDAAIPVIEFRQVPLNSAVENLARQADLNYILDPKVFSHLPDERGRFRPQPLVTLRLENVSARAALESVAREYGLRLSLNPATGVMRVTGTNQIAKFNHEAWIKAGTNAPVPLIQMMDTPLAIALRSLAKQTAMQVEIEEAIENPRPVPGKVFTGPVMVSFRWQHLTPRQAIAAVCENYDLTLTPDAGTGTIRIARKDTADKSAQGK
jgi:hypothetical protein